MTTRLAVSKRLASIKEMRRHRPTYEQLLRQTHVDNIWGKKAEDLSDQDLLRLFDWYSEVNPALYCLLGNTEALREEKMLELLLAVCEKQELRPGEILFKTLQRVRYCFIALRGTFSISVSMSGTASDRKLSCASANKIMTVKEGQVFGYEDILSSDSPEVFRSVQARADGFTETIGEETTTRNCEVLKFAVDDFLSILGPVLRKRQRLKMLNEFYLHSRLFRYLRVQDTLCCAAYTRITDYFDGQYVFRESRKNDPNIPNVLFFVLSGTVVLSLSSSKGSLPLKHLCEGSVIVASALKQSGGVSQPFTVMANTLNVVVLRLALPLYIYLLLNSHHDQTMIQTASAEFSQLAQRQKRFFRESVTRNRVGQTLADPDAIFQTVFKKSYFLEGLFARDLVEKQKALKAMGLAQDQSIKAPPAAADSPDRHANRKRLMAARRAQLKEEQDLKRRHDKLTNHFKQKTWVDNIMQSNWVDAEVLATRKGDGRKSLARHGKALLKLEQALFSVPEPLRLSPTSRLRAQRQQKRSKLNQFKQKQRDRQHRFNKARGGKTKRLMTLAQKLEQDLDEHLSRIDNTEALDDVLVQQAHDEALIEFEYQRREEAEADGTRDKLLEQELYRTHRRSCLKTVCDRETLKSRQDHLHAMRQMLQTRQQLDPPTLIPGTRKVLVKQIGFERRQLPNLYTQRQTSNISPYYTPKNPFRKQAAEINRVLKSMQEAYDDIDQFVNLESSPPAKAVTNVRSKQREGDALDDVVEEVERRSPTHSPADVLSSEPVHALH